MEVPPPSAAAPPSSSSATLPSDSPAIAVAVRGLQASPAVSSSSSTADSSISSPLHSALFSALSFVSLPPTWYYLPPLLSFLHAGRYSVVHLLPTAGVAAVTSNVSRSASSVPRAVAHLSLYLLPTPLPPPLPSLGILNPPLPSLKPTPPALATDFAHKDKDVGDQTVGVETRWLTVGGSTPCGKSLTGPLP